MGAIKDTEKIDLILQIEIWKEDKHYDRLGLDDYFTNILGIDVPSLFVPVKTGPESGGHRGGCCDEQPA